jgi:hypothetical protein
MSSIIDGLLPSVRETLTHLVAVGFTQLFLVTENTFLHLHCIDTRVEAQGYGPYSVTLDCLDDTEPQWRVCLPALK